MAAIVPLRRPTYRVVALRRSLSASEMRALQEVLGQSFHVEEGWFESDDIVVAPLMTEPVIGLLKSRHPGCLIFCVLPHGADHGEVVHALDSGADGCLVSPSMAELAAHLKALARSRDTRRSGLTDRLASGHP
jgi:hypothetical protein